MFLHVYDHAEILQYMRSDDGFILGRLNDDIAGDGFSAKIKYTKSVRAFFDAAIGQLERNRF